MNGEYGCGLEKWLEDRRARLSVIDSGSKEAVAMRAEMDARNKVHDQIVHGEKRKKCSCDLGL